MANNPHDDQETLSLTDFPLPQDHDSSIFKDNHNPSSSSNSEDLFEFFNDYSEDKMIMSHAEDIIFCGKLLAPTNQQLHITQLPQQSRRSRFESISDAKSTIVRNSRSLGYKNLRRNSSTSSEPVRNSVKKSSSSRRHALLFGLVNVPQPEMNIRDLKNRQVRMNNSSESLNELSVSRSVDHRKGSWRVLEFLSCKPSSGAVMTPLSYMAKV